MDENNFELILRSFRLAGSYTTHALSSIVDWNGDDGEGITPMLAGEDAEGKVTLIRTVVEDGATMLRIMDKIMDEHSEWVVAAKVHSGVLTTPEGERLDAIVATSYLLTSKLELSSMAIPFRVVPTQKGFRFGKKGVLQFGRTKVLSLDPQLQHEDIFRLVFDAYHEGNYTHFDSGIWDKHLVDTF